MARRLLKTQARLTTSVLAAISRGTYPVRQLRLHDGAGLYLRLNPSGGGYWFFRYLRDGRERFLGLGNLDVVGAAEARERARELRIERRRGGDPLPERQAKQRAEKARVATLATFASEAALIYAELETRTKPRPLHPGSLRAFRRSRDLANAAFGKRPIDDITVEMVAAVVMPELKRAYESGMNVRAWIERVISHGRANGRATLDKANPADKAVLGALTATVNKPKAQSFAAMPWPEIPHLVARLLAKPPSVRREALLATILSGLRVNELCASRWAYVDGKAKLLKLPATEMKMLSEHHVPISSGLERVLATMRTHRSGPFIFPQRYRGDRHMELTGPIHYLREELGVEGYTVHGFRSSLRAWGGASVDGRKRRYDSEIMERVLAHEVGGVQGAYDRDDFLAARAEIMEAWSRHCFSKIAAGKRGHLAAIGP
jgi:integrase